MNFSFIVDRAVKPSNSWTNVERANFEYFNENGIVAKYRAAYHRLLDAEKAGKCKSGALFAYEDTFNYDQLSHLRDLKKVNSIKLRVCLSMYEAALVRLHTFLAEIKAVEVSDEVALKYSDSVVTVTYTAEQTFDYVHDDGSFETESRYDVVEKIVRIAQ